MERTARYGMAGLLTVLTCILGACDGASVTGLPPSAAPTGEVVVSPAVVQRLGVRTALAELGSLPNDVGAPGIVRYDESSTIDVTVPLAGWLETSVVRAIGDRVTQGELLFEIYSPSLVTTDRQYLESLATGADPEDNPYARGLLASGLSEDLVAAVREKRRKVGRIPFRAVDDSIVSALQFREGSFVTQGAAVLQVVSADRVWVVADFPQAVAAQVSVGAPVTVTASAYPGWRYEGAIAHVYAQVAPVARSVQARIVVPSSDPPLLVGMYVAAVLHRDAGEPTVNIPASAVIRGQDADRVIVALGDGRFAPRGVRLGRAAGDRVAVLDGLAAGEAVVTQATFLIDAEASIRASLARLDSGDVRPAQPADPGAHHIH